ncbi:hypothetical protein SB14R_10470 [Pseudomonas oryzihabitans]|nr:hypothetical protein SB14R_10470 [Pseudomonas psychrotolerans]
MRVYPTPGLVVRDPVLRDALPAEGRDVPDDDLYWVRRVQDGDVTLTPPAAGGRQVVAAPATQPTQSDADKGSDKP